MQRLRILMIGGLPPSHPQAGGGQLVAYELSEALASAGHSVDHLRMSPDTERGDDSVPGLSHIAPRAGERWPSAFLQCLRGVHLAGYDIIHVHTGSGTLAYYLGYALRRYVKRDVKLALTIHSPKVHALPRSVDEVGWLLGCRAAATILAVSDFSSRDIARCYRVNRAKIKVVYNGVDIGLFHPLRARDPRCRDVFTLLFCGRLNGTRQKGLEVLLDAMPLVLQQHRVVLNVIGAGPRASEYKRYATRLQLDNHINFLGFVEHNMLPQHYGKADLLVLPSRRESFGLVVAEAMACGVPVVATRVGAIPELVEQGVTGLLVSPDDPQALADAINSLLGDPDRMQAMGARSRDRIAEYFTWDKAAERVIGAYHLALGVLPPAEVTANRH